MFDHVTAKMFINLLRLRREESCEHLRIKMGDVKLDLNLHLLGAKYATLFNYFLPDLNRKTHHESIISKADIAVS